MIHLQIDNVNGIPKLVTGEKKRLNYLTNNLIKISSYRTLGTAGLINVRFSFYRGYVSDQDFEEKDYLFVEVSDNG